ncbi:hypothetical protein [Mycobacterium talmoniae]|uniref:ARB-07466-like C-terminal domain-containing protein n=1 Tax=Mycobacterium talmoniae TaxID=1858794 RepID=A0A1S1NG55_9MYCO|nr:hypothetical protein [Mycobacterium talmoniae]OHV00146.1 hypothetical protein BKN37_18495 [Mycobacterium talmoniae]
MTVDGLLAQLDGLLGRGRVATGSAAPMVRQLAPPAAPANWSSPAADDLVGRNNRLSGNGAVFAASDDDAKAKLDDAGAQVGHGKNQMGVIREDYRRNRDRMAPAASNPEVAARMAELDRQRASDGATTVRNAVGRMPQIGGNPAMGSLAQMMPAAAAPMAAMAPALSAPLQAFSQIPALMGPAASMLTLPHTVTHNGTPHDNDTTNSLGLSDREGRLAAGGLPPGVASESGLQTDTILAARAVSAAFPEISEIGGVRDDPLKWHPNGQAIDVMLPDRNSPNGKALGDQILAFALRHQAAFHLNHICWQQRLYYPDGSSEPMGDRGGPTANHMDHVHIATNGGGYPHGGEVYSL